MIDIRTTGGTTACSDACSQDRYDILEEIYAASPYPTGPLIEEISAELHISVNVGFLTIVFRC